MTGIKKSTTEENLEVIQKNLRPLYGDDYVVKPEGVISNIGVAISGIKLDFENQLLFLKKNLNPYTAKGIAQDGLYSLRNMKRRQSTYTIVQRMIEGEAGAVITAGSLLFENSLTKDQFQLDVDVTLAENGKAVGTFKALQIGAVDLPPEAKLNILTPLSEVSGVYYTSGNTVNLGVEYEGNEEFTQRFLFQQNESDPLKIALLDLVDNPGNLRIIQNRGRQVYGEIPLRSKKITIYSAHSDEQIAKVIFDNLVDAGFDLVGDIVVNVLDDEGQPVEIRFNRAVSVDVYIKTTVVKNSDASDAEAKSDSAVAISDYYTQNSFVMGEKIVANRFNAAIDAKPSIQYPVETLVSVDGINYMPILAMDNNQIPVFSQSRIEVEIEEN